MVNVPTYNPWAVYGQPIAPYPGYAPLDAVGAVVGAAVQFGLSFAVGAFSDPIRSLELGTRLARPRRPVHRECLVFA